MESLTFDEVSVAAFGVIGHLQHNVNLRLSDPY